MYGGVAILMILTLIFLTQSFTIFTTLRCNGMDSVASSFIALITSFVLLMVELILMSLMKIEPTEKGLQYAITCSLCACVVSAIAAFTTECVINKDYTGPIVLVLILLVSIVVEYFDKKLRPEQ